MKQPLISEISRKRKFNLIKKHLSAGSNVLEVGAGSGWFSMQLKKYGYIITTLDINPPADIVGNINQWSQLGIPAHSYDAVIALEVIEHVDCLAALRSVCKVGGMIFLSSPHPHWDWLLRFMEICHLTQPRTSTHSNLTDFNKIGMPALAKQRPLFIHQVAIFKNIDLPSIH